MVTCFGGLNSLPGLSGFENAISNPLRFPVFSDMMSTGHSLEKVEVGDEDPMKFHLAGEFV